MIEHIYMNWIILSLQEIFIASPLGALSKDLLLILALNLLSLLRNEFFKKLLLIIAIFLNAYLLWQLLSENQLFIKAYRVFELNLVLGMMPQNSLSLLKLIL